MRALLRAWKSALVRMRNFASTKTVRRNTWINFKVDFLVCKGFELVIEQHIKLGKEMKEIIRVFRCKVSTQIHDLACITSFMQTIQCFRSKVIIKREAIFVILFVVVKTILQKMFNGSGLRGTVKKFVHGNRNLVTNKMAIFEIKLCCAKGLQNLTADKCITATFSMKCASLEFG